MYFCLVSVDTRSILNFLNFSTEVRINSYGVLNYTACSYTNFALLYPIFTGSLKLKLMLL